MWSRICRTLRLEATNRRRCRAFSKLQCLLAIPCLLSLSLLACSDSEAIRRSHSDRAVFGEPLSPTPYSDQFLPPSPTPYSDQFLPQAVVTPDQGDTVVLEGDAHEPYLTNPPTSGPHYSKPPVRGSYVEPFADEFLVRFESGGGVLLLYNAHVSPEAQAALTALADREFVLGAHLVLAPRPDMPCGVAVAARRKLLTFGDSDCQAGSVGREFDPANPGDVTLVRAFIDAFQCLYDPAGTCWKPDSY